MKNIFMIAVFYLIFCMSIFSAEANTSAKEEKPINIKADNVEYTFKKDQEIGYFTGNVILEQEGFNFYGDKVTLFSSESRVVGEGNLKIISEGPEVKLTVTGGKGEYSKEKQYAIITELPKLIIIEKDKDNAQTEITGNKIEMFSDKNEIVVTKNVHIIHSSIEAWSDYAVFYQKSKKLVMTENAKVTQRKNIFSAEEVVFFMEDNRIIMNKKVQGIVIKEEGK